MKMEEKLEHKHDCGEEVTMNDNSAVCSVCGRLMGWIHDADVAAIGKDAKAFLIEKGIVKAAEAAGATEAEIK